MTIMKIHRLRFTLLGIILCGLVLFSCSDDTDLSAPRLFRPIATVTVSSNTINLAWEPIGTASAYQLELSVDSFKTTCAAGDTVGTSYTFRNLVWDQTYQIRLKAISSASSVNSSEYYVCDDGVVTYPTKLQKVNVTDIAARVSWSTNVGYTKLVVSKADTTSSIWTYNKLDSVIVGDADNALLYKDVKNLTPLTNYKVTAYIGDTYSGSKTFKTKASENYGTNVIDLRGLSAVDASDTINTAFMSNVVRDGATVVLEGSATYTIPGGLVLNKSISFVTGLSLSGNAIVKMNGCSFSGASNADIRFKNINIVTSANKAASNFGGGYVFNNASVGTLDSLTFSGCSIKYMRGIIRLQSAVSTIGTLNITNCIMDSIGNYGVTTIDVAGAAINNMNITNSTLAHAEKILVSTKSAIGTSTAINNCTFAYCGNISGTSAYYLFDFGSSSSVALKNSLLINNCIFGGSFSGSAVNGYRCSGTGATYNLLSSYKTSDLTWALGTDGVTAVAPLANISSYSGTVTSLWNSPTTSDFTFKDKSGDIYKNKIGDPRWY